MFVFNLGVFVRTGGPTQVRQVLMGLHAWSLASYWRQVSSGMPPCANWKAPSAEPPSQLPAVSMTQLRMY